MCSGKVKSVDRPTMDDKLSNEALKSSGGLKQKKIQHYLQYFPQMVFPNEGKIDLY